MGSHDPEKHAVHPGLDVPIGPKGPAGGGEGGTLAREWTQMTPDEECRRLEELLDCLRREGDVKEAAAVEARLRMLHAR